MPILMHTLSVFNLVDPEIELILVIPESDFTFWKNLCFRFDFKVPHKLVKGGKSRFQSVKSGLDSIEDPEGIVAIHDGVRPFVIPEVIEESFLKAGEFGSAIAVVELKDSIRKLAEDSKSFFQDRQSFRLVQTPQTFLLRKIKKAYEVPELKHFTDDATVFEHQGWQVFLIPGNPGNIKITSPEDLEYASFLIQKKGK
jgi:2-C-methyl-D-erythritol 4-phosphate cytidylyltransferase